MRPTVIINVFLRDFRKQRKRMSLTLLAILWGTFSIMLLLAFGEGLKYQMKHGTRGLGEGIVIVWGGQTSIPFEGFGKGRHIPLVPDDIDYIRQRMPELEAVSGEYIRWGATVKFKDKVLSERINGLFPDYEQLRNFIPQMGGRFINEADIEKRRRVAFLGDRTYERLFSGGSTDARGKESQPLNPVGQTIEIGGTPFTVIGVMQHKMQGSSYQGRDEDVIAIPASTFVALFGDPYLDNIIYKPADKGDYKGAEKRLFEVMGAKHKFHPDDESALWTWDIMEEEKEEEMIAFGIQLFLGMIGALTLIIAGVGVANIMYVSVRERTREIGIKMALGARRIYILVQFVLEALWITLFGGALGMAMAYVLTEAFRRVEIDSEAISFMGKPTVSLEIGIIVTLILGIIGFLSGLFPAMKASSVDPVQSLRYE
jgi:putative ABC transport system permease protein